MLALKKIPPPVVEPTYTIEGLTHEEFSLIRGALRMRANNASDLWKAQSHALIMKFDNAAIEEG